MDRLQIIRRASQLFFIAALLLLPVFDILRYDVASKTLYMFGSAWELGLGDEFYSNPAGAGGGFIAVRFLLKAILPWLAVLSVFPLLGVFLGRAFCGWACPEGALFEFADEITLRVLGRRSIYGRKPNDPQVEVRSRLPYILIAAFYLAIVPPFFGVMLTGYFIAPERIWREITSLDLSFGLRAGIIGVSIYMVITFIFVRHAICKYLCGAGLMQMLFGWVSPISLVIRFHPEGFKTCTDCRKCEEACFMDVKPRSPKRDINCVNCGECVSACRRELGPKNGLFDFSNRKRSNNP